MSESYTLNDKQLVFVNEAKEMFKSRRSIIDTSMMGLGKTVQNLILAKEMGMKVLIFCIVSNVRTWKRHVQDLEVGVADDEDYIVPYTSLQCSKSGNVRRRWISKRSGEYSPSGRFLDMLKDGGVLIIFDEIHNVLNPDTKFWSSVECLVTAFAKARTTCRISLLSGTIIHSESKFQNLIQCMGLAVSKIFSYDNSSKKRIPERGWKEMVAIMNSEGVKIQNDDFLDGDIMSVFENVIKSGYVTGTESYITIQPIIKNLTMEIPGYLENEFAECVENRGSEEGITNIHNMSLIKSVNILKLVRSILLENKHKVIMFASSIAQYNFIMNNLDESLESKTRMIIGKEKQDARQNYVDLFQQDDDEVTFLIIHHDTCTGLSLQDLTGSWPRIIFSCPTYRFDTMIQQVYRVVRFNVSSTPRIYVVYERQFRDGFIHDNISDKGKIQRRMVKFPNDIIYPDQWTSIYPEDDEFLSVHMKKIHDLPKIEILDKNYGDGKEKSTDILYNKIMKRMVKEV